jgi:hypothetical protein
MATGCGGHDSLEVQTTFAIPLHRSRREPGGGLSLPSDRRDQPLCAPALPLTLALACTLTLIDACA